MPRKKQARLFALVLNLFICVILIVACESNEDNIARNDGGANQQDTGSDTPQNDSSDDSQTDGDEKGNDPEFIQQSWAGGPHGNTFVVRDNGENNSCAQCHAPINWMPSMDDLPESCLSCKFEIEDPPPFVAEEDWLHIPCKTCHKLDKKDLVEPEISWLEIAPIDEYAEVSSATELCLKCHFEKPELSGHPGTQVVGVHADFNCTDCHDSHATTGSCSEADCHQGLGEAAVPIAGHDQDHLNLTCAACHDGGGFEVNLNDDGFWITYFSNPENNDESYPFYSHNFVLEVLCDRCHYPENPWDLSDDVSQP